MINYLGIGGQRCGTTWIYNCLMEHPEILKIKKGKEIHFFSHYFNRGFQWYHEHFQYSSDTFVKGEFSVSYLYDLQAPERVFNYNPNMKILLSLRNPIDRAFSQHLWHIKNRFVKGEYISFENAIKNNPSYIEQGLYYKYLKNWFEYFEHQNIHVMRYEESIKNPLKYIKQLYNFLNINDEYIPHSLYKIFNSSNTMGIKYLVKGKLLDSIALINKKPKNAKLSKILIKDLINEKEKMEFIFKEAFIDDIHNLSKLLNIKIDNWI